MPLLELKSITKDFPGVRALDGVSFDLEPGEVHALCGENGAGKSTLIKVLCGYHPYGSYGGEVLLEGKPVRFKTLKDSEERGIALIAQELALVPELSVAENLTLGREPVRGGFIDWRRSEDETRKALDRVGLQAGLQTPVREMGVGQQQSVEIAKALSKNARILVLDEPTAALPEEEVRRLFGLLRSLRDKGFSCVYISHRLEEVGQIADRVTVLRDGKSVLTEISSRLDRDAIIAAMVGREVTNLYPRPETKPGEILLAAENFSVGDPANPGRFVVEGVSFELRAGEILGVAGLMGAGRTAFLSSLFGAARGKTSGTIKAGGVSLAPFNSPGEAIQAGLALVSEDRKRYGLVLESTVGENLVLASMRKLTRHGFLDSPALESESEGQARSLRIKAPSLSVWVNKLSGGNQQKVVLGKWLMTNPKVLLLDEPTRGIDVGAKAEVYELMGQLAAKGMGIILVSSDLPELLGLSHRVMVLSRGKVTANFAGTEALPDKVMAAAVAN